MGKQKRSLNTYQKINTLFKRNENGLIVIDEFCDPTFDFLKQYGIRFRATEKIDGTCIRLEILHDVQLIDDELCAVFTLHYKGKTDNAQVPKNLMKHLKESYPEDVVLAAFGLKKIMTPKDLVEHGFCNPETLVADFEKIPDVYDIYGEGYGAGIQSGGYYCKDNRFRMFDVKVGNLYLLPNDVYDVASKISAPVVPYIGHMTIEEAIEFVRTGFESRIAEETHLAEGLVLTTDIGLKFRNGERIVFKLKTNDFRKLERYESNQKI